jgi:hypothetical protein
MNIIRYVIIFAFMCFFLFGAIVVGEEKSDIDSELDFDKLVFVKRYTYQSTHYYTDFIDGCERFGGNICILSLDDGKVSELVPSMSGGIFGRYDLSFDGERIVFDWKEKRGKGFRIYEVGVDGTGLKQLTFDPPDESERIRKYRIDDAYQHHTDDMHPCYLPDGDICFISSRCEYGILCDAPDYFTTTVLYRMDADGRNMEKLSNSAVSEAFPAVMNDGRILYTRWEYVDKGATAVKCLWAMRPDGSGSVEIYGNDIDIPSAFIQGRAIEGRSNFFIAIGSPHCCPTNGIGTVIRVDISKDIRTDEPMTYLTPDVRIPLSGHDGFMHKREGEWVRDYSGPLFIDPYPLSEKLFLVSHNVESEWNDYDAWDLYLLDESGGTILLYDDTEISCYQPMPLRSRVRPPIIRSMLDSELAKKKQARVVVTDVYQGLDGIERGAVKYIRVNEQIPRPWGARRFWDGDVYDQQHACITKDTHLGLKVQHGIVPVDEDGSAHFLVPADRNIFLQVLDENFMEVQRERTYVNYRSGETRSCLGCHERTNNAAVSKSFMPTAVSKPPDLPGPQAGEQTGKRVLHYPSDVQPILDKHCINCHSGDEPEAELDLTGTMTRHFSRSYENLIDPERELMKIIGENHLKWENINYLPPKSLGSHASRLVKMLLEGHSDVKLSRKEMVRLTTWVDSNGQYYGSYYGRRNTRYREHPNFRPVPTFADAVSTRSLKAEKDR